jgi:hypothetical protein
MNMVSGYKIIFVRDLVLKEFQVSSILMPPDTMALTTCLAFSNLLSYGDSTQVFSLEVSRFFVADVR